MLFKTVLTEAVNRNITRIADSSIIDEITTLVVDGTGRVNHMGGKHDDTLVAWLLGCFLLMYGRELSAYGLMENEILVNVTDDGTTVDPNEKALQQAYATRLAFLRQKVDDPELSAAIIRQYKTEIKFLSSVIDEAVISEDVFSVNQASATEAPVAPGITSMDLRLIQYL